MGQPATTKQWRQRRTTTPTTALKYLVNISEISSKKYFFIFNFQNHFEFQIIPKASKTQPATRKSNRSDEEEQENHWRLLSNISCKYFWNIISFQLKPQICPLCYVLIAKEYQFFWKSLARLPSAPKEGKRYSRKAKDIQRRQKIQTFKPPMKNNQNLRPRGACRPNFLQNHPMWWCTVNCQCTRLMLYIHSHSLMGLHLPTIKGYYPKQAVTIKYKNDKLWLPPV